MDFIDQKIADLKKLELQKTLLKNGWIDFKDKLPEHGSVVKIYWSSGKETALIWVYNKKFLTAPELIAKPLFWRSNETK